MLKDLGCIRNACRCILKLCACIRKLSACILSLCGCILGVSGCILDEVACILHASGCMLGRCRCLRNGGSEGGMQITDPINRGTDSADRGRDHVDEARSDFHGARSTFKRARHPCCAQWSALAGPRRDGSASRSTLPGPRNTVLGLRNHVNAVGWPGAGEIEKACPLVLEYESEVRPGFFDPRSAGGNALQCPQIVGKPSRIAIAGGKV
jgi:hypothetical protein